MFEQFFVTFSILFFKTVLSHHGVPALFNKQNVIANCQCKFKAIVWLDCALMLLMVTVIAEGFSQSMLLMASFADVRGIA